MTHPTLSDLGWSDHFARLAGPDPRAARIAAVHRDRLGALSPEGPLMLVPKGSAGGYAVGDFVLHDGVQVLERLAPRSEIARRAAGTQAARQLIAANVDTLAVVTSCNADFNEARLERYLAMAEAAGCLPLVVVTKADLVPDARVFTRKAEALSPLVTALALDARDPDEAGRLAAWAGPGQTLALTGSSGTGKTTILNALAGASEAVQGIRENDAKGRHTTTQRALRRALAGGWIVDTPGMRELALSEASEGIDAVFADLAELETRCRFNDCRHETEPGCAVRAALEAGEIEADRLARWDKLRREDRHNSETLAEAHHRDRKFGRMVRGILREKRDLGLKG